MSHWARAALATLIGLALTGVVIAPLALSSGDLVEWARSPLGLGLADPWPLVVFVALDCAAAVCVGFVVYNAWQGEGAGTFGLLVWLFAGGSAVANYRHGQATTPPDDAVFFAGMSLAGPLLLHTTVHRIRRWARTSAGEYAPRRPHFGLRWLPGVAFRETWEAWRESIRAGISNPAEAVARVRERRYLQRLSDADRIRYAHGACATQDPHVLRIWLLARGLDLSPAEHEQALWHRSGPATSTSPKASPGPAPSRPAPRAPTRATQPVDFQERVEAAYLKREIAGGEVLEGKALAREIDGHDRRARRAQELLRQLRTNPTEAQHVRIEAARQAASRTASSAPPALTAVGGERG